jgi:formate--tetrahydrofolate ligase
MNTKPILSVANELGISEEHLELYGRSKAKVSLALLESKTPQAAGRLILVTAINPTPAGEGKTTTSIGLAMGLRKRGKNAVLALREPSLGPVFGVKGGGTGGGKASLFPADDINLHFTGDIHAITTAHNLLSAMIDNSLHFSEVFGEKGRLDPRQVTWGRALDMNDRALRNVAILSLATSYADLEARLARIVVGTSESGKTITAQDVGAASAMCALLRDALKPNLVQTEEGGPAFVHCGPFANIAHGCNSVLATRFAMKYGDYAITEAGFGFDLGGEKFLDIKCREMGVWPRVVVLVATLRALKMHGGAAVKDAAEPNKDALRRGLDHLDKHLENAALFGLPCVVAINVFPNDTDEEVFLVEDAAKKRNAVVCRSMGFAKGGEGTLELADVVAAMAEKTDAAPPVAKYTYSLDDAPKDKIAKIAKAVYGATDVNFTAQAEKDIERAIALGLGKAPICMAKTQLSLSDDPKKPGRPMGFTVTVREVRASAGAGFLVALTGEMMTMPGLPKVPAARGVRMDANGVIKGLMQND